MVTGLTIVPVNVNALRERVEFQRWEFSWRVGLKAILISPFPARCATQFDPAMGIADAKVINSVGTKSIHHQVLCLPPYYFLVLTQNIHVYRLQISLGVNNVARHVSRIKDVQRSVADYSHSPYLGCGVCVEAC